MALRTLRAWGAGRGAAIAALGCAALLLSACTSAGPARTATAAAETGTIAHASPRPSAGLATGARRRQLASLYLLVAGVANDRLETDFDALEGPDHNNLAAARVDLRKAAATERVFDLRLLGIAFPPATKRYARFLYWFNQSRAKLTDKASHSVSLRQLHAYEAQLTQANRPVEYGASVIRSQLGLPPPDTS
jgi:hypothetical protein